VEDLLLFYATLNISEYQTCSFDCYSICQYFVCVTHLCWCCSRRGLSTEERRSGQRTEVYCGANKEKMPSDQNIKREKGIKKRMKKVNKTSKQEKKNTWSRLKINEFPGFRPKCWM
jgi:hypothetical protein